MKNTHLPCVASTVRYVFMAVLNVGFAAVLVVHAKEAKRGTAGYGKAWKYFFIPVGFMFCGLMALHIFIRLIKICDKEYEQTCKMREEKRRSRVVEAAASEVVVNVEDRE